MKPLVLALLLAAPAVQAQMYKCTEGGKTRFSDKPFTDCKSATTVKTPPPSSAPSAGGKPPPATGKPPPGMKPPPSLAEMKAQVKGAKKDESAAKKGTSPRRPQKADAPGVTERDKKYAAAHCKDLREEEAWLKGPRSAKLENREARLGQVRQALAGCR